MANSAVDNLPESAYALGELREDFRFSMSDLVTTAAWLAGCFVVTPIVFYCRKPGILAPQDASDGWALAGCLVFMGMFLMGGIGIVIQAIPLRHMRLLLFEDGIVSFKPDRVFSCRFDDVEWIKESLMEPECLHLHTLTLHVRSGDEWMLDRGLELLNDSQRLAATIEHEVTSRQLPAAIESLERGESLDFESVKLTPLGIEHNGKVLPWAELQSLEASTYNVQFRRHGAWLPWATIKGSELKNRQLLLEVVEEMMLEQAV